MYKRPNKKIREAAKFFNSINDDLSLASPGASIVPDISDVGLFIVSTPNRNITIVSPTHLKTFLENDVPLGESALISTVTRSQEAAYIEYEAFKAGMMTKGE